MPSVVYRKRVSRDITIAAIITLGIALIVWPFFNDVRSFLPLFCLVIAVMWWYLPLEWLRAVTLTDSEFAYRYNSGRTLRIMLSDIERVDETSTDYMLGLRPVPVPALKLTLKNGSVQTLPLDFPDRDEIMRSLRLRASIAPTPAGTLGGTDPRAMKHKRLVILCIVFGWASIIVAVVFYFTRINGSLLALVGQVGFGLLLLYCSKKLRATTNQ
jgi:hypothetical protein